MTMLPNISKFNKPLSFIVGNHDYIYEDTLSPEASGFAAMLVLAKENLNRFKQTFSLPEVFYSQKLGNYWVILFIGRISILVILRRFLNAADLAARGIGKKYSDADNRFFHAPLKGTVSNYNATVNGLVLSHNRSKPSLK